MNNCQGVNIFLCVKKQQILMKPLKKATIIF